MAKLCALGGDGREIAPEPGTMNLKMLLKQHADFAAAQDRKAAREARKAEKERQWTITKENNRKRREQRERRSDIYQQRRLEDDPDYWASSGR